MHNHPRRALGLELLAAGVVSIGLALTEAARYDIDKQPSLVEEYRRLLEELDHTLWGDENCGEAS